MCIISHVHCPRICVSGCSPDCQSSSKVSNGARRSPPSDAPSDVGPPREFTPPSDVPLEPGRREDEVIPPGRIAPPERPQPEPSRPAPPDRQEHTLRLSRMLPRALCPMHPMPSREPVFGESTPVPLIRPLVLVTLGAQLSRANLKQQHACGRRYVSF